LDVRYEPAITVLIYLELPNALSVILELQA